MPRSSSDHFRDAGWVRVTGALIAHAPARDGSAIGRVLVTFDPDHRHDLLYLQRVREAVLKCDLKRNDDEVRVHEYITAPPAGGKWRRWEVPRSITEGVPAVLCDIRLDRRAYPRGLSYRTALRETTMLRCEADPNPGGGIAMLPFKWKDFDRLHDRYVELVAQRGQTVKAALVQANPDLFRRGDIPKPGLVFMTFENDIPNLEDYLLRLSRRAYALKKADERTPDEEQVARMLFASDKAGYVYRRCQLPVGFTGGPVVYSADIIIAPRYLRRGKLTEKRVFACMAEPGDAGAIEMLPYWEEDRTVRGRRSRELEDETPDRRRAREDREPEEPPRVSRGRRGFVFGVGAVLALAAGGAAAALLFPIRSDPPITLVSAKRMPRAGMLTPVTVEYELRPDELKAQVKYFLVLNPTRGGVAIRQPVELTPQQPRHPACVVDWAYGPGSASGDLCGSRSRRSIGADFQHLHAALSRCIELGRVEDIKTSSGHLPHDSQPMIRLGVNIDHVATIRQARREGTGPGCRGDPGDARRR